MDRASGAVREKKRRENVPFGSTRSGIAKRIEGSTDSDATVPMCQSDTEARFLDRELDQS